MKYFLQQKIEFEAIDDFTGIEIVQEGTIVGYGDAVRKMWKDEMALADDSMYLVEVKMSTREIYFAVYENEIIKEIK